MTLPLIGHLTPSRIALLDECERRFQLVYVEPTNRGGGKPPDDTEDQAVGYVLHRAAELAAEAGLQRLAADPEKRLTPERLEQLLAADRDPPRQPEILARVRPLLEPLVESLGLERPVAERLVEEPGRILVDDVEVWLRWDRIDVTETAVDVIDWKFGDVVKSHAELEADPQALLYLAAAAERWPLASIVRGRWVYVARGLEVHLIWTPELDRRARDVVRYAAARIRRLAQDKGEWPGRLSGFCSSCPFRLDRCSAFRTALEREPGPFTPAGELVARDPEAAVSERARVAAIADVAEERRKELDAELRPILATRRIETEELTATLSSRRRAEYPDTSATVEALARATGRSPWEIEAEIVERGVVPGKVTALIRKLQTRDQRELAQQAADSTASANASAYVTVRRRKGAELAAEETALADR